MSADISYMQGRDAAITAAMKGEDGDGTQNTLTSRQAAHYLGVSDAALRLWRSEGRGRASSGRAEKLVRYRRADSIAGLKRDSVNDSGSSRIEQTGRLKSDISQAALNQLDAASASLNSVARFYPAEAVTHRTIFGLHSSVKRRGATDESKCNSQFHKRKTDERKPPSRVHLVTAGSNAAECRAAANL